MKRLKVADKNMRIKALRLEIKKKALKTIAFNSEVGLINRSVLYKKMNKLNRRFFATKTKKVCLITGRARAVNYLGLSRMKSREYQMMGVIAGLKKYSW